MTEMDRVPALSGDVKLTDALQNRLQANGTLLAEMDPKNILNLAGLGVIRLSLAGLSGRGFEAAVQMMLLDRNTTLDEVLAQAEQERQKAKIK